MTLTWPRMQPSSALRVLREQRDTAERLRVATLLSLVLHGVPLLSFAGGGQGFLPFEALRRELPIEVELAPSSVEPAGSEGMQNAGGDPPLPGVPSGTPREPEPPDPIGEPETTVTPAGADSTEAEHALGEGASPESSEGESGTSEGLFAGSGTGTLHAVICFIPETTRWLWQIRECTPIHEEYLDRINIPRRPFTAGFPGVPGRTEYFAVNIQGGFHVSHAGRYHFRLKADDGAVLFVDGQVVVDNDGVHEAISRSGEVELSAGPHRVRVWYFQGMRYEVALQLFVTPPGGPERIFTPEL